MNDLTVIRSGELMVAGVKGDTEEGVDFVDAWFPPRQDDPKFTVVDSGQLVIQDIDVDVLVEAARADGLTVEIVKGL